MNEINTLEKIENIFKDINCYGEYNYCFSCSTIQNTQFGLLGVLISNKINKNIMGYLLNQTDKGIALIPIVKDTLTKNKLDIDNFTFIKQEDIKTVKFKNENFVYKNIIIILKDNKKIKMQTLKKNKNIEYHEQNLNKFIKFYEEKNTN